MKILAEPERGAASPGERNDCLDPFWERAALPMVKVSAETLSIVKVLRADSSDSRQRPASVG
jgi:hypothetical protein